MCDGRVWQSANSQIQGLMRLGLTLYVLILLLIPVDSVHSSDPDTHATLLFRMIRDKEKDPHRTHYDYVERGLSRAGRRDLSLFGHQFLRMIVDSIPADSWPRRVDDETWICGKEIRFVDNCDVDQDERNDALLSVHWYDLKKNEFGEQSVLVLLLQRPDAIEVHRLYEPRAAENNEFHFREHHRFGSERFFSVEHTWWIAPGDISTTETDIVLFRIDESITPAIVIKSQMEQQENVELKWGEKSSFEFVEEEDSLLLKISTIEYRKEWDEDLYREKRDIQYNFVKTNEYETTLLYDDGLFVQVDANADPQP